MGNDCADGWHANLSNPPTLSPVTISIITILTRWALSFAIVRLSVNRYKLRLVDCKCASARVWITGNTSYGWDALDFMAAGIILSVTYSGLIISRKSF